MAEIFQCSSGRGIRVRSRAFTGEPPLFQGSEAIERGLDPGAAFEGDLYAAEGLPQVPCSLPEAAARFEASELARRAFGEEVVAHLLHFARTEQREVDDHVSDVERARYFERI